MNEFSYCLKHSLAIYENGVLAPGYRCPDQQRLEAASD